MLPVLGLKGLFLVLVNLCSGPVQVLKCAGVSELQSRSSQTLLWAAEHLFCLHVIELILLS